MTYYNLGDLATGREIRCRRFSADATPEPFRARSAQIIQAICGTGRDAAHATPSAEASLLRFWSGPARADLAGFLGVEVLGACVGPQ